MSDSDDLKDKVLATDSSSIRHNAQEEDKSADVNFEQESKKQNHAIVSQVKEETLKRVPFLVTTTIRVGIFGLIILGVLVCNYLLMIWGKEAKVEAIIVGALTHIGTFLFGTLATVIFKNKKSQ